MIEIKRGGTNVELKMAVNIPLDCQRMFLFTWNAGSEWAAGLLANAMRNALNDAVKQARAEEYEAGWKDAKSHKKNAKKDWFAWRLK